MIVFHKGRRIFERDSVDDITEALENVQMDRPSSKTYVLTLLCLKPCVNCFRC